MENSQSAGGRPSVFDAQRAERIIEAIELGHSYKTAADAGGIHVSTLHRWRALGDTEQEGPFREFCDRLYVANAKAASVALMIINKAAAGGEWKAATWFLERRFPKEWGKNASHEDPNHPFD